MDNLFDYSIGTGLTPGGNRYVYNHHTNQQFSAPADANIEQQHYWVRGFMAAIKKLEKSFEFYPERCITRRHPDDIVEALREPAIFEREPGRWDEDMGNDLIASLLDLVQKIQTTDEGDTIDHVPYRYKV